LIASSAAPVIVIGMHRSGTSLLTAMLGECGVFRGWELDEYHESRQFQAVNERLFAAAGATWDRPADLAAFLARPDGLATARGLLADLADETFFSSYFGPGSDARAVGRWGWKDPRNTYTLPLWLELFPAARVIHILRNGTAVALSLRKRETSRPEGRQHPHYSARCQSLEGCLTLWREYVARAREVSGKHRWTLEITFEALLRDPAAELARVAAFMDLPARLDYRPAISLIRKRVAGGSPGTAGEIMHPVPNVGLFRQVLQ